MSHIRKQFLTAFSFLNKTSATFYLKFVIYYKTFIYTEKNQLHFFSVYIFYLTVNEFLNFLQVNQKSFYWKPSKIKYSTA